MTNQITEILDLHHPHDSLFKQAFKHKQTLIDFLHNRLEPTLLATLDLTTLKLENSTFIDSKAKKSHSDLIFSAQTPSKNKTYIYLLLEHQSQEDNHMILRLLEYNVKLMRQHITQLKTNKLPNIINLVLYTGQTPYKGPQTLLEAIDNPALYKSLLERKLVTQLARESDQELIKDKKAALAEFILTYSRYRDFCKILNEKPLLLELIKDSEYAEAAVIYILAHEKHQAEEILEKINKLDPDTNQNIMNALQRIQEKGKAEGKIEGKAEGLKLGKYNTLQQLVQKGIITQAVADALLKEEENKK